MPGYVEDELRGYLECGLLCFGFARAVCMTCRTGFVVAFSCKGRGVCPSCNGRHMAQTAAHLADYVIPPVPVRQWVISVPKRLRGMLADRTRAVNALTKIFLDEIERLLCAAAGVTSDAATPASACPRLGGITFLHRFGSALNRQRDRSPRPIWPRLPSGCAAARSAGSACSGCSTPRPPPTCSPGRTAGFQSMRVSGSRSYRPKCVSSVSLLSTFSDTAPGHHSRLNGSP